VIASQAVIAGAYSLVRQAVQLGLLPRFEVRYASETRRGTAIPTLKTRRGEIPLKDLIRSLKRSPPHVVKGTAVFLTSDPIFVPTLPRIACAWRRSAKNSPRSGCASAT
jgi:K+ transporter